MKERSNLTELNALKIAQLERDFPPEVVSFMYSQRLTIKEISNSLGCGTQWVRNCLRSRGTNLRVKNDYGNPTDDPGVRKKIAERCVERGAGGWTIKDEEKHLPGILYLVRYLDEDGTHFKIGITKLTLAERFRKGQLISILALHTATLGECFDLEQSLLKWAKENNYRYSSPTTTELLHAAAIPHVLATLRQ
jgi:hypothetical protein